MDGKSLNISEEKLDQLKEILPEIFTENKIDWEKLKAALGDNVEFKNERYVLNWAGKSDAFRALQSASTATLVPCKEESVNFDETQNIFIEYTIPDKPNSRMQKYLLTDKGRKILVTIQGDKRK